MSVLLSPVIQLFACAAIAFVSLYVIANVKKGVRPSDHELMQSKIWPERKKWLLQIWDWFWRGALDVMAWTFLSFSTAVALVTAGEMMGVMTPTLGGFIVTLALIVSMSRIALLWLEDISAFWHRR